MGKIDPLVMAVGLGLALLVFSSLTALIWQDGQQRIEAINAGVDVPERNEWGCLAAVVFIMLLFMAAVGGAG